MSCRLLDEEAATGKAKELQKQAKEIKVEYLAYDWSLNFK